MNRVMVTLCLFIPVPAISFAVEYSDVSIDSDFKKYLESNPLIMELTGATIIKLPSDKYVVLAVASTAVKDGSPQDRLRAERVCRIKALAYFVGEREGVQVVHVERSEDKTRIEVKHGTETAVSISDYLELTTAQVSGMAKGMPVIGRWKSADGDVFYLAIGAFLNGDGAKIVTINSE